MTVLPELVYLVPLDSGPFTPTPGQSGLAQNFAGGSNYFAWTIALPVRLQPNIQLAKPFKANTVTFKVAVSLENDGTGPPAPGAVTASSSLSTVTNGLLFAYNNLNLVGYNFNGNIANYEFQGSAQPPVPIPADLLSTYPSYYVALGVQLPLPCIGANPAPGALPVNPQILSATPTQPFDTGIQLLGDPTLGP